MKLVFIVIGFEGGWFDVEVEKFNVVGFLVVSLGFRIL